MNVILRFPMVIPCLLECVVMYFKVYRELEVIVEGT